MKNRIKPPSARRLYLFVKRALDNAVDFLYPPFCILCDLPLKPGSPWLCDTCDTKLRKNNSGRDACPLCAIDRQKHRCACDLAWDHPFERIYSLFSFDNDIQRLAHSFKYKGRKNLVRHLGNTYSPLIPSEFFENIDAVVAVPLHFFRKMKRGYNQSEYFARGCLSGRPEKIPYHQGVIRRVRHTKTQTKLDSSQRRENLAGAFSVDPGKRDLIVGKNLILTDDVITTGATTAECAQTLLDSGAKSVRVLTFARA